MIGGKQMRKNIDQDNHNIKNYDEELYPTYDQSKNKIYDYPWVKVIITLLGVSLLFAFIIPWYLYIAGGLLGIGLMIQIIRHSSWSKSKKSFFLLLDMIGVTLLLDLGDGKINWAVDYAIPFLILVALVSVMAIMFIKRRRFQHYVGIQIYSILMAVVLNILLILNITHIIWPSIVALGLGVATLAIMVLLFGRAYSLALIRFLHI